MIFCFLLDDVLIDEFVSDDTVELDSADILDWTVGFFFCSFSHFLLDGSVGNFWSQE